MEIRIGLLALFIAAVILAVNGSMGPALTVLIGGLGIALLIELWDQYSRRQ